MKIPVVLPAIVTLLLGLTLAQARLGDDTARSMGRYGQPVATSGQPGELTSTRTFSVSNLQVTCGYVKGTVEMITYTRSDRAFLSSEVEAILRTNARKQGWSPSTGFTNGDYHTAGGTNANVKDNTIFIHTPTWDTSLAQDQAAEKAAAAKAASGASAAPVSTNAP